MIFEDVSFKKARFIKSPAPFVCAHEPTNPAPLLRRTFMIDTFKKAELRVCTLGYGEFYINGRKVTQDKFIAPVSDYMKTLWVTAYDVTDLLVPGENTFAAVLGNGFFNEPFRTSWDYDKAPWRDSPKLIAELTVDGEAAMYTGEGWKCLRESAIVYNQLRSGEHFDARRHIPGWNAPGFDDSAWENAVEDNNPPTGQFRLCDCPPVRECAFYPAKSVRQTGEKRWLFDIGQNISGYVRLNVCEPEGTELVIRYAEELDEDGAVKTRHMTHHYPESEFMTDRFISDGKPWVWSPRFVYHGFQFIEITGLTNPPTPETAGGVFVHQDVKPLTEFHSEDERLNRLFEIGRMATLSNLMYMPTDCPTREKLGWCNDAQASCNQMLINFDTAGFFRKWLVDIFDAMRPDGALPGIVPTSGWGYEWGNGPVSDGILFEIPYQLLIHTGDDAPLKEALPYFRRYLKYLETRKEADGLIHFGLDDWAPPTPDYKSKTPATIINAVFRIKFLRIAAIAEERAGSDDGFAAQAERAAREFREVFLNGDGTCRVDTMTAAALTIRYDLYTDFDAIKRQLMRHVEACNFHHDCGMVGMPSLFPALEKCGLHDWVMKILTSDGYPGYMNWLDKGATTLWEMWQCTDSHNHHMYSCVLGMPPFADAQPGFPGLG